MANPVKIATALSRIKGYKDPATKKIEDWEWKPIEEVTAKLDYPTQVPDYIQGGYGNFMNEQAKRATKNELNARDLLKAYGITRASVNRGGLSYDTATKAGLKVPRTQELVRPEGAFSEWLGSPLGQQYLKSAERGEIDPQALKDIQRKFSPFGMPNQLASDLSWAAQNLPQKSVGLSEKMLSDPSVYRPFSKEMVGIGPAKSGFMASMLGRGDFPTFDARQINLHTRGGGKEAQKYAKRGKGQGGEEAVERLAERQKAMGLELDPSLDPFYQHLTHHTIWDKIGDSQTTHDDVIKAMRNYKHGGLAHLAGGGDVFKEMVKAYKLFRKKPNDPETLYPLFVNANKPVPVGEWLQAEVGPLSATGKVKSKLGELAYRPGWHAGDLPIATHIGAKSNPSLKAPDLRPPEQVWAEIDMPADVNWQEIANQRAQRNKSGLIIPRTAHITDEIPFGGHYRYKTSPNMEGNWLISGDMRVNRVLDPEEVMAINEAAGVYDLPRYSPLKKAEGGLAHMSNGGNAPTPDPELFSAYEFEKLKEGLSSNYNRGAISKSNKGAKVDIASNNGGNVYQNYYKYSDPKAGQRDYENFLAESEMRNDLYGYAEGGKTPAWQRAEGKNPEGGLNAKGRASYKAETGGTLKRPQPEGGARRDSFCARMTGMKKKLTSSKTASDPNSRINKALRKWNC
jgi:hypothetical protein